MQSACSRSTSGNFHKFGTILSYIAYRTVLGVFQRILSLSARAGSDFRKFGDRTPVVTPWTTPIGKLAYADAVRESYVGHFAIPLSSSGLGVRRPARGPFKRPRRGSWADIGVISGNTDTIKQSDRDCIVYWRVCVCTSVGSVDETVVFHRPKRWFGGVFGEAPKYEGLLVPGPVRLNRYFADCGSLFTFPASGPRGIFIFVFHDDTRVYKTQSLLDTERGKKKKRNPANAYILDGMNSKSQYVDTYAKISAYVHVWTYSCTIFYQKFCHIPVIYVQNRIDKITVLIGFTSFTSSFGRDEITLGFLIYIHFFRSPVKNKPFQQPSPSALQ